MSLKYEDLVKVEQDRPSLEDSLNDYIALLEDGQTRMALKRKGARREKLLLALSEMAAIFAAARIAYIDEDFDQLSRRVLQESHEDTEYVRDLRIFYLNHARQVTGANDEAFDRIDQFSSLYQKQTPVPSSETV